jgi:galactose mutarotase-like enzyme
MANQTRVLIDTPRQAAETSGDVLLDQASTGLRLSGADNWSIASRTLRGGLSDGVEVIDVCNGPLTVSVLPTRGMGIWRARFKDLPVGWESPVRLPVHPRHVELGLRNGLGWLDGFGELLCRCGLAHNGPPGSDPGAKSPIESQLTLHGRIANLPAHRVEVQVDDAASGALSVTGVVDECTLFGPQLRLTATLTTHAGSNSFAIRDEIINLGSAPTELEVLYHVNVGPPFLAGGSTLHCPARVVAPRDARAAEGIDAWHRYLPPTPGYAEQAYFFDLIADAQNETVALLRNEPADRGVSVHFDREQLPCFTLWKCTQADADGYVTGLEPGTNFPNFKAFERGQGRVINLAPGETYTARLRIEVHDRANSIAALQERIAALQIRSGPVLHRAPTLPYSPP